MSIRKELEAVAERKIKLVFITPFTRYAAPASARFERLPYTFEREIVIYVVNFWKVCAYFFAQIFLKSWAELLLYSQCLFRPFLQIAIIGYTASQIIMQFLINIL